MEENFSTELLTEIKGIQGKTLELAKEFGTQSAQVKQYQDNTEKKWAEFDKKNEDLVQKLEAEKKANEEAMERVKHLELIASSKGTSSTTKEQLKQYSDEVMLAWMKSSKSKGSQAWKRLAQANPDAVSKYVGGIKSRIESYAELPQEMGELKSIAMELKTTPDILRTDIGEMGNFLCPIEWSNELLRQIIEISPIRKYARVKQIGAKTLEQPIRQGIPTALWEGETQSSSISQSNYTNIQFSPYRLSNITQVTWDMLNDNSYNIVDELIADNALAFAKAEGLAAVSGSGAHQSLGFTADPNVPIFTTAASATLSWQDMVNVTGQLKTGYDPMYFFNRFTLAYLRTLTDNNGRPLWLGPFGNIENGPATINGYKYSAEFIDMQNYNVAQGVPVLFADMKRMYEIVDRTDVIMIRDELTAASQAIVKFTLMKWTVGMPVMKEAGILVKLHA